MSSEQSQKVEDCRPQTCPRLLKMCHHRVPRRHVAKQLLNSGFECTREYFCNTPTINQNQNEPSTHRKLKIVVRKILKICHHSKKTCCKAIVMHARMWICLRFMVTLEITICNNVGSTWVKVKLCTFRCSRSPTLNQLEWSWDGFKELLGFKSIRIDLEPAQ